MFTSLLALLGVLIAIMVILAFWVKGLLHERSVAATKINQLSQLQEITIRANKLLREANVVEVTKTEEANEKINTRTYFD